MSEEDFSNFIWNDEEKETFKGYTPYWEREPQARPEIFENECGGLTQKSEKYLRKIIHYTQKQGSELILIVAPYVVTVEDKKTYNQIAGIAKEEEIPFVDYNEYYEEIGLDFSGDFNDDSHLNYWGSYKFTDYLGADLINRERIPDRSGSEGYESWERHAQKIREEAEKHNNLSSVRGLSFRKL